MLHTVIIPQLIQNYCLKNSSPDNTLLENLVAETVATMPGSQMLSDPLLVKLLSFLVSFGKAQRVLEIGTYTGYASLAMAAALGVDGQLITCDIDARAQALAQSYFARSPHGHKIKTYLGPALVTLKELNGQFDLVYLDANKSEYPDYYQLIFDKLSPQGIIVVDNTLQRGEVANELSIGNLAKKMTAFNLMLRQDPRVEVVLLPFGDGVSLIRKKNF